MVLTARTGPGGRRRQAVALPVPDAAQSAVLAAVASDQGHLAVVGGPGTGKTTLALMVALQALSTGSVEPGMVGNPVPRGVGQVNRLMPGTAVPGHQAGLRVAVLAATRRGAAQLGERLALLAPVTACEQFVLTPMALAFAVLRQRAVALDEPPPQMITGPEQDAILAQLLEGQSAGEGRRIAWPDSIPPSARGFKAFRDELRDLLMRAAENGLDPVALDQLGRDQRIPEWVAAAQVFQEYIDVQALRGTAGDVGVRLDAAALIDQAARALADWELVTPDLPKPAWDLVVVDDYVEATAATARLLAELAAGGARLVVLGCPDTAVQTYRGALPGLLVQATDPPPNGLGASLHVLTTSWRYRSSVLHQAIAGLSALIRPGRLGRRARQSALPQSSVDQVRPAQSGNDHFLVVESDGDTAPGPLVTLRSSDRDAADRPVEVAVLGSAAAQAAAIAQALRAEHLGRRKPWSELAVIVRSTSQVEFLRSALAQASVPVLVEGLAVPVRDEPAVRPLLTALRCVTQPETPNVRLIIELLTSPLGGLDSLGIGRLRRALRQRDRATGGDQPSDDLLLAAISDPELLDGLQPPAAVPATSAKRISRILAAGRHAASHSQADAETVLYALWEATGLQERWRTWALGTVEADLAEVNQSTDMARARSERADRDLDAVVALMDAAKRYVERHPHASAGSFAVFLDAQAVPADTLAPRSAEADRVFLGTAADAAGRQWSFVAVAGVQDGTWPDLRLRDTLLGAGRLGDLQSGRLGTASGVDSNTARGFSQPSAEEISELRRAVLDDELRSFVSAISRASERLMVTAVQSEDDRPSEFVTLLTDDSVDLSVSDPPAPLDLRGLVASLRAEVIAAGLDLEAPQRRPASSGEEPAPTAQLLAALAVLGVPGADPLQWAGLVSDSSQAPLFEPEAVVTLSPSKLETLLTCPLRWALERSGGHPASTGGESLGTLLHELAQKSASLMVEHSETWQDDLRSEFERRWAELNPTNPGSVSLTSQTLGQTLDQDTNSTVDSIRDNACRAGPEASTATESWLTRRDHSQARVKLERLLTYIAARPVPLAVEAKVDCQLQGVRLRGSIDRVESAASQNPISEVRIVDFKSGQVILTKADAASNPQLGAYQVAVNAGALDQTFNRPVRSAEAALVYIGHGVKEPSQRVQTRIDPAADWMVPLLVRARQTASSAEFAAVVNSRCGSCPVRSSCPAHETGQQVTT